MLAVSMTGWVLLFGVAGVVLIGIIIAMRKRGPNSAE